MKTIYNYKIKAFDITRNHFKENVNLRLAYEIIRAAKKNVLSPNSKSWVTMTNINALATINPEHPGGNNKRLDKDLKAHIQCKLIEVIKK